MIKSYIIKSFDEFIKEAKENKEKTEDSNNVFCLTYLNKDKDFKECIKEFSGADAYTKAIEWGTENLDNFNMNQITVKK